MSEKIIEDKITTAAMGLYSWCAGGSVFVPVFCLRPPGPKPLLPARSNGPAGGFRDCHGPELQCLDCHAVFIATEVHWNFIACGTFHHRQSAAIDGLSGFRIMTRTVPLEFEGVLPQAGAGRGDDAQQQGWQERCLFPFLDLGLCAAATKPADLSFKWRELRPPSGPMTFCRTAKGLPSLFGKPCSAGASALTSLNWRC